VFVRRSTDKKEVVDGIKSMLAPYAQKGVYNPASLAAAMDTNNTSKIKRYLNDAYNVEKQYQQALEDSKNEAAKYSADMAAKTAQEANELKKYEADKRYEAAIDVALITAQGYLDDSETPGATGGEDTENAKIAIQNKKLDLDAIKEARAAFMDSRKQEHTEKMDKIAVEQKDRELSIKARKSTSSGK
jgi:hypothetical protein